MVKAIENIFMSQIYWFLNIHNDLVSVLYHLYAINMRYKTVLSFKRQGGLTGSELDIYWASVSGW